MGASEIEVIALCTVAVRMALVKTRTAKVAVNPATVSKAFKARMSDTHVFYAARCTDKNGRCSLPFLQRHICTVENLNGA